MAEKTTLPDCLRISIRVFMTSDKLGVNTHIAAKDASVIDLSKVQEFIDYAVPAANSMLGTDDCRPMTDEEVKEYLEQEREDD